MKTYLKNEKYLVELFVFDREKLSKVRIYNDLECEISYLDDEYDFKESISIEINHGSYIVNEREFNKSIKKFKEELNIMLCD